MNLFNLIGRIAGKKLDSKAAAAHNVPRVDLGLPLGARLGGLLELPRAQFAVLDNSLLTVPAVAQQEIVAASRIRMTNTADLPLFRLYTDCGNGRAGNGEDFLQILGEGDEIRDVAYYQFLCRRVPVTAEEQEPYQGQGYGLGELHYWLGADLLQEAGLGSDKIAALLAPTGDDEALLFQRDAPGGEYLAPYQGVETRIDDPYGEKGLTQRLWFMTYARELAGGVQERLLISFEVQDSFDGQSKPRVHADFMVGLGIDPQRIKII